MTLKHLLCGIAALALFALPVPPALLGAVGITQVQAGEQPILKRKPGQGAGQSGQTEPDQSAAGKSAQKKQKKPAGSEAPQQQGKQKQGKQKQGQQSGAAPGSKQKGGQTGGNKQGQMKCTTVLKVAGLC